VTAVPPGAIAAATAAVSQEMRSSRAIEPDGMARAALEAAAPLIAAGVLARVEQGIADGAAEVIAQAAAAERERACEIARGYLDGNVWREFRDEVAP
jgi:hypothetical protein